MPHVHCDRTGLDPERAVTIPLSLEDDAFHVRLEQRGFEFFGHDWMLRSTAEGSHAERRGARVGAGDHAGGDLLGHAGATTCGRQEESRERATIQLQVQADLLSLPEGAERELAPEEGRRVGVGPRRARHGVELAVQDLGDHRLGNGQEGGLDGGVVGSQRSRRVRAGSATRRTNMRRPLASQSVRLPAPRRSTARPGRQSRRPGPGRRRRRGGR